MNTDFLTGSDSRGYLGLVPNPIPGARMERKALKPRSAAKKKLARMRAFGMYELFRTAYDENIRLATKPQ